MSIADDLRASECAGCDWFHQERSGYCDICGRDAFVAVVAGLEADGVRLNEARKVCAAAYLYLAATELQVPRCIMDALNNVASGLHYDHKWTDWHCAQWKALWRSQEG